MRKLKTGHWLAIAATVTVIVLLLMAPTHEGKFVEGEPEETEMPSVENQIDSALQMVNGDQPMQGILRLRSIADAHPENWRAQYQLGLFSMQTNQWEKAAERFRNVLQIDKTFSEAKFWLGKCEAELGNHSEALKNLTEYLNSGEASPELEDQAKTIIDNISK